MADLRRAAEMRQWVRVDWLRAIADHSNDAAHCARRRVMGNPHCGFPHYPLKQREDAVRLLTATAWRRAKRRYSPASRSGAE
jgi:hypothetical protein